MSGRHGGPAGGWVRGLLALTVLCVSLTGCKREAPVFNGRFVAFGTLVDLSIIGASANTAQRAARDIEQDLNLLYQDWHPWAPGPLARVNQQLASGAWAALPPSMLPLIRMGQDLAERSGDLFNPAIGRLNALWGFHVETPECQPPPEPDAIRALVAARPSMSDLELDGIRLRSRNPQAQLDFSHYARGYGIDLAIARLRALGVQNALINMGGNVRAIGDRDGQPWRVPIRRASGTGVFAILAVSGDESVFTASDHERNYSHQGKTYHHLLDPRTGYPAAGTHAVTVAHQDAVIAEAAATALFIAGPRDWFATAKRLGVRYVLLMDGAGQAHMTPAMAKRLSLLQKDQPLQLSPPL